MAVEIIRKCGKCGTIFSPAEIGECPYPPCRFERRLAKARERVERWLEVVGVQ